MTFIWKQLQNCVTIGKGTWQHLAITWTNVYLSSGRSSDIHLKAISEDIPQPLITKVSLRITYLRFHANLSGANELIAITATCSRLENKFCCVLFCCHYNPLHGDLYSPFINILQGCFTATEAIITLPQCLQSNSEEFCLYQLMLNH